MISCIREHFGCHAKITIQQTNICGCNGERLRERGAFAPNAQRGECLGFYTGERKRAPKKSTGRHTMLVDEGEVITPRQVHLAHGRHPIASVNEPPPGHSANCVFICWYKTQDVIMYCSMPSTLKKRGKKRKPGPSQTDHPEVVLSKAG